jgi:hypothetical protein
MGQDAMLVYLGTLDDSLRVFIDWRETSRFMEKDGCRDVMELRFTKYGWRG